MGFVKKCRKNAIFMPFNHNFFQKMQFQAMPSQSGKQQHQRLRTSSLPFFTAPAIFCKILTLYVLSHSILPPFPCNYIDVHANFSDIVFFPIIDNSEDIYLIFCRYRIFMALAYFINVTLLRYIYKIIFPSFYIFPSCLSFSFN